VIFYSVRCSAAMCSCCGSVVKLLSGGSVVSTLASCCVAESVGQQLCQ